MIKEETILELIDELKEKLKHTTEISHRAELYKQIEILEYLLKRERE